MITVPIHIQGIDTIQMKDQETHRTICIEISQTNETEAIQKIEITDIKIDREIIQTTDQINKDLIITIIKIDHEKIHKKRNSNYNNRQKNYSQSTIRNNTRYPDSQKNI